GRGVSGPAWGAVGRTGALRATAFVGACSPGAMTPCGPVAADARTPLPLDWPPRRFPGTTRGHRRSSTDAARRPSRRRTVPTPTVWGEGPTEGSIPRRVPGAVGPPAGVEPSLLGASPAGRGGLWGVSGQGAVGGTGRECIQDQ